MKERQRIDKILEAAHQRIQEEVGGLIGAELTLTNRPSELVSKEDFFDQPMAKQVFAIMELAGDLEGVGGLLISVKDAIRLGGTLIMLPPSELEEVVASENYDGETEDSYGEIANIIAGSYTKTFEEMYPKGCRFIRKEQQVLVPIKVDIESDEPIPNEMYYQVTAGLTLDDTEIGDMVFLIPALPFQLVEPETIPQEQTDEPAESPAPEAQQETESQTETPAEPETNEQSDQSASPDEQSTVEPIAAEHTPPSDNIESSAAAEAAPPSSPQETAPEPAVSSVDTEKQKKRVDSLLEICRQTIEEEVGAMLGVEVTCSDIDNRIVDKETFFFDEASGKQVVAYFDVVGELEDRSFLYIGLRDAIRIGSTLIMLPPSELETAVSEEDFNVDAEDAYGEIANIISGVYTAVFEEQYTKSIRFIKKEIEQIVPMKVDISSETPMPDQHYYMSSMKFSMDGNEYGKIQILFPAAMLQLQGLATTGESAAEAPPTVEASISQKSEGGDSSGVPGRVSPTGETSDADILLISDSQSDADLVNSVLQEKGYTSSVISFRDNINAFLPGSFKAVFIITNAVDEQAFGLAIKVSTSCNLPIIATGAEWTRTKVIKAVKYGVTDILLTPATADDVAVKIENNIVQLAA
ncbi:MAG: hypothetical protein D6B25_16545 [Desulfobulbaceae bacterium]|nr:MAG: hypothetical protein D6B25_16545 [Desulfobulbaceae bacterium]